MTSQHFVRPLLAALVVAVMPACAIIGGVFEACVGVGIFMAVVVVGLIFFLVTRARV
jgi:hypothetical protein